VTQPHGDQHCTPTAAQLQAGRDGRIKLICSDYLCQYAAQCDAFHNLKQLLQLHYYRNSRHTAHPSTAVLGNNNDPQKP
jgi:hypothetical protein